MNKAIKASGNTVEPYWPALFAKAVKGINIGDLLTNISSGPAPAAGGAAGPAAAAEDKKEDKKEEKEEEEADMDMGGLFGDDY